MIMDPFTSTTTIPSLSERCQHLAHPDVFPTVLSAALLFGILGSYIPQHAKIYRKRTSEGLSQWWVLLGGLSSIAAMGNILTLPTSRADMMCCRAIDGVACASALLGVVQIGVQWACFMFIVMLFLIFFPSPSDADLTASTASLTSSPAPNRRDAVIVGSLTLIAILSVAIISTALVFAWPHHTQRWANLLGTIAGVLAAIQYLPQIWYTYRLGDIKSLSMVTMFIQVPGAFLFAFNLWQRVGWEGWSTWLMFVVTGALQGVLLGLAISYYMATRRAEKDEDSDSYVEVDDVDGPADAHTAADERSALLGHTNGHNSTKNRPIAGTHRSNASAQQLGRLYAATPPDMDSDRSSNNETGGRP